MNLSQEVLDSGNAAWLKIKNDLVTNIMTFVNMQLFWEMFDLATEFARNKKKLLRANSFLFLCFCECFVSSTTKNKQMKKKLIWSDLDYRKDVTVTMKLINYDLLLLDAIWLTTGLSRGL